MLKDGSIHLIMIKKNERPLPIGKNKKVIGLSKNELGGKIMTEFTVLSEKAYAYLIYGYNDDDYYKNKIINKKAKGTKVCSKTRAYV